MIKTISIVKQANTDPNTLSGSLAKHGHVRIPGTFIRRTPFRDVNGVLRTGLDPDAKYINDMSEEEAQVEREYVTKLRDKAEKLYGGIDLSPNSRFYADMYKDGNFPKCPVARMLPKDNLFNLDVKEQLIVFAYMRVRPDVAPSSDVVRMGKFAHCIFYVNDSDIEDEKAFKVKELVNKALAIFTATPLAKRGKIGRQLGLPITDFTAEATVYRLMDDFIKQSEQVKNSKNAELFLKFAEMRDENLDIRDIITQAITMSVLRKNPEGKIFRGEYQFAKNYEEAVSKLVDVDSQEDLTSIIEELKMKKSIKR